MIYLADGDRLSNLLKERKIKQNKFADMVGVHEVSIGRAIKSIHLNTEDIQKFCEALNMEIWEFFIDKKNLADKCKVSQEMLEISKAIESLPPEIENSIIRSITAYIDGLSLMEKYLKKR